MKTMDRSTAQSAQDLADVCNQLAMAASPLRLRALRCLAGGPVEVAELCRACGLDSAGTMALQLDLLRHAGLVDYGAAGERTALYRLTEEGRDMLRAVSILSPIGRPT
jgi:DNA-binding transcriptional ArsR family regulator